ncbi:hypothetical protein [Catellatospora citrea]|uniref:Alpha/beta hydrolase n=1 Tax=Catellatospora citrea TaxID=53366 RepID=A0A8J3P0M5_9ACTN|nr:hypothetical protein [Catellatospora citrea]GIF98996.1 hypothetical protein Cci01nite_40900 [Catellatospora citrea]
MRNQTGRSQVAERWLSEFRERSGVPDAKVVILARGMGGLLSRYWVEKLGGWTEWAALITLGTPYRGAVRARMANTPVAEPLANA